MSLRSSGTTGQSMRPTASSTRSTPRGPAMRSTRAQRELLEIVIFRRCCARRPRRGGREARGPRRRSSTPDARRSRPRRARRGFRRARAHGRRRSPTPATTNTATSASDGIPRIDDADVVIRVPVAQRTRRVGTVDPNRDGLDVEPFDRVRCRPISGHPTTATTSPSSSRGRVAPRRSAVRSASSSWAASRAARSGSAAARIRAHDPPQRAVAAVVREQLAARHHERCRLGRESGEGVGGLDREPIVVEVAAGDRTQSFGGSDVAPHGEPTLRLAEGRVASQRRGRVAHGEQQRRARGKRLQIAADAEPAACKSLLRVRRSARNRHGHLVVGRQANVGRRPRPRCERRCRRRQRRSGPRPRPGRRRQPARARRSRRASGICAVRSAASSARSHSAERKRERGHRPRLGPGALRKGAPA